MIQTRNYFSVLLLALVALSLGACSKKSELDFKDSPSNSAPIPHPTPPSDNEGSQEKEEVVVMSNSKTISLVSAANFLKSSISVTGVINPSAVTKSTYEKYKGSLSPEGAANTVTAPMLMAMTNINAEVCNDLVAQEKAVVAANRRFFRNVNFAAGPSPQINAAVLDDLIRRFSRSFWGRNETAEEKQMISEAVLAAIQGQTAAAQTEAAMLFACTSMLSSVSAIEL